MPKESETPSTPIAVSRDEISAGTAKCHVRVSSVPGTMIVELTTSTMPMPVASVYYRWIEPSTLEYLWVWSHPGIRGCGVCELIEEWLCKYHEGELKRIVTPAATRDSEPFLKSRGYEQTEYGWMRNIGNNKDTTQIP